MILLKGDLQCCNYYICWINGLNTWNLNYYTWNLDYCGQINTV